MLLAAVIHAIQHRLEVAEAITVVRSFDDRQLADMGIARHDIARRVAGEVRSRRAARGASADVVCDTSCAIEA